MKKYIYKLTYKNFEIIAGELAGEKNFEKYFSSFIKLKKFLKEKGISTTKEISSISGRYGIYTIEKIEVQ